MFCRKVASNRLGTCSATWAGEGLGSGSGSGSGFGCGCTRLESHGPVGLLDGVLLGREVGVTHLLIASRASTARTLYVGRLYHGRVGGVSSMRGREVGVTHGAARLARDVRHAIVRDDPARQARRPYGLGVPPDPRAELCESVPGVVNGGESIPRLRPGLTAAPQPLTGT